MQVEENMSQVSRRSSRNAPSVNSSRRMLNLMARRSVAKNGGGFCQWRDAHLSPEKTHPCTSKIYRMNLCKRHHLDTVKRKILNSAKSLFTNPLSAFAQLDF